MSEQPARPQPLPCKYRIGKVLGHGTYSVVKVAVHCDTGKQYAVKVISKRLMSGKEHMVRNEIIVLRRISRGNKNILTLVDYFETTNNLYLVTDLARGGELFDRIYQKGSFYERDAAKIVRCITDAVAYLHRHGVVHRDLKPENLLFKTPAEDSDLLIADFGLSRIIDEEKFRMLTTTCGTPSYMAPEIFRKTGHGKPVDIWAIGVIAYFLLCGYFPFDRDTSAEEMDAILSGDYSFEPEEYWQDVSDRARDFIAKCLQVDVSKRMTAEETLAHEFLTSLDSDSRKGADLLPNVKSNIDLRRLGSSGIDSSSMMDGGATTTMEGAFSKSPEIDSVLTDDLADDIDQLDLQKSAQDSTQSSHNATPEAPSHSSSQDTQKGTGTKLKDETEAMQDTVTSASQTSSVAA